MFALWLLNDDLMMTQWQLNGGLMGQPTNLLEYIGILLNQKCEHGVCIHSIGIYWDIT